MKAENLNILAEHGLPVPPFICVEQGGTWNLDFSEQPLFAVRSSAEGEDGDSFSFAGQFVTELNVPRDKVGEALARVFASGQNDSVQQYRSVHGISDGGPKNMKMSAMIQEMVPSDLSGVIFTANPMGLLNEMVLVAGRGTGDGVVEDRTEVTTYYYNVSDKLYEYEVQGDSPVLEEGMLQKLLGMAQQIRDIFEMEMDIEYAIAGGEVSILQARPITTFGGKAGEEKPAPIVLDNSNIVESYPGISLPATHGFVREVYYLVFERCLMRLTGEADTVRRAEEQLRHMVEFVGGRAYYRISNWYDIILFLPFHKKIIPIWQEMLGVSDKRVSSSMEGKIRRRTRIQVTIAFFQLLITNPRKMRELNTYFEEQYPMYRRRVAQCKGKEESWRLFLELKKTIGSRWDITLVNDMYTFLFTAMAKRRHEELLASVGQL